eukprot:2423909-Amphidinium_carterae.1
MSDLQFHARASLGGEMPAKVTLLQACTALEEEVAPMFNMCPRGSQQGILCRANRSALGGWVV